jgi:hypothetical protein
MAQAQTTVEDLAASFSGGRLSLNNEYQGNNRVEITGLDLLNSVGNLGLPEALAAMSFSDESSSSDISYSNDSLEMLRHGVRGRMHRRPSNDSYSNDSVEVAKNKKLQQRNSETPKDTVPLKHVAMTIKLSARQMDVKNIAVPSSVSPDLAGLKPMTISNHAA